MPNPDYFTLRADERITKLEDAVSDLRSDVAVLKVQVQDGFELLQESVGRLATKIDDLNLNERLTKLEDTNARREGRVKVAVRIIGATLSTFVAGLLFFFFGIHR